MLRETRSIAKRRLFGFELNYYQENFVQTTTVYTHW